MLKKYHKSLNDIQEETGWSKEENFSNPGNKISYVKT